MAGYCTHDDVCSAFPQFVRNQPGSISDAKIQGWIDDRKARIRSVLLTRGYDPDNPPSALTDDQKSFLRSLNREGVQADLGTALEGTLTLQPGEYSLSKSRRDTYERILKEIQEGKHDKIFQTTVARTGDPQPLFKGIAGAETDPDTVDTGNRFFSRNQIF